MKIPPVWLKEPAVILLPDWLKVPEIIERLAEESVPAAVRVPLPFSVRILKDCPAEVSVCAPEPLNVTVELPALKAAPGCRLQAPDTLIDDDCALNVPLETVNPLLMVIVAEDAENIP